MSAEDYPPVRGPSARQVAWAISHGKVIPKKKWKGWTFSESFKARYGVPVPYWSHWNKLISFSCRVELLAHSPRGMSFVYFCQDIDTVCERSGYKTPERIEMEALYAQYLLHCFDTDDTADTDCDTADNVKRDLLKSCMMTRLGEDAEQYWLRKQNLLGLPSSAISRLDEEAEEPEGERSIDFRDYDSMEVDCEANKKEKEIGAPRKSNANNVRGPTKMKKAKKVRPSDKASKNQRRRARRAILMAKMETIMSTSMVQMKASLEALRAASANTRAERKALKKKRRDLNRKMMDEAMLEIEKSTAQVTIAPVAAEQAKIEPAASEQAKIEQAAAKQVTITKHEPIPFAPMKSMGLRTLAFRPK